MSWYVVLEPATLSHPLDKYKLDLDVFIWRVFGISLFSFSSFLNAHDKHNTQ